MNLLKTHRKIIVVQLKFMIFLKLPHYIRGMDRKNQKTFDASPIISGVLILIILFAMLVVSTDSVSAQPIKNGVTETSAQIDAVKN